MIYFQRIKSRKEHILFEVAKSQNDGSESGDSQRFVAISEHIPPSWVTKGSHFNPETEKRSKGLFTLSTLLQTPPKVCRKEIKKKCGEKRKRLPKVQKITQNSLIRILNTPFETKKSPQFCCF